MHRYTNRDDHVLAALMAEHRRIGRDALLHRHLGGSGLIDDIVRKYIRLPPIVERPIRLLRDPDSILENYDPLDDAVYCNVVPGSPDAVPTPFVVAVLDSHRITVVRLRLYGSQVASQTSLSVAWRYRSASLPALEEGDQPGQVAFFINAKLSPLQDEKILIWGILEFSGKYNDRLHVCPASWYKATPELLSFQAQNKYNMQLKISYEPEDIGPFTPLSE